MRSNNDIVERLQELTGQKIPFPENVSKLTYNPFEQGGIGYSQFNELLLTLGYDRVREHFFRYLFGSMAVQTYDGFVEGINRFRKHAILLYGNVKFAFKKLSALERTDLDKVLEATKPRPISDFESRHGTLHGIQHIEGEDAYFLGYIVEQQLKDKLSKDPTNQELQKKLERVKNTKALGKANHNTYLTYDHMDVYIATSMREKHEFWIIRNFIKSLFATDELKPLKLRWFDPTQAYCEDRIDKGLVEALMVKRAKCTIYHVQEA